MGTLMGVMEPKQYDVLASCSFAAINQLMTHIKKKTEKVVLYFDQDSGWVQTQEAVSQRVKCKVSVTTSICFFHHPTAMGNVIQLIMSYNIVFLMFFAGIWVAISGQLFTIDKDLWYPCSGPNLCHKEAGSGKSKRGGTRPRQRITPADQCK